MRNICVHLCTTISILPFAHFATAKFITFSFIAAIQKQNNTEINKSNAEIEKSKN